MIAVDGARDTQRSSGDRQGTGDGPPHAAPAAAGDPTASWIVWATGLSLATVFLKNYWVSEDAYLTFRSVAQLLAGNGPIWNPHERVQVFTSPLWYWLCALAQWIVGENYLAILLLSSLTFGAALVLLRRLVHSTLALLGGALLLVCSSACFDYTSAGMENVLGYALLAALLHPFFVLTSRGRPPAQVDRSILTMLACAGLLLLTRHDLSLLAIPPTLLVCLKHRRAWSTQRWLATVSLALVPLLLWSIFALVYYGSPLPNTAYAKLSSGFPRSVLLRSGFDYFVVLGRYDIVSLLLLAAAPVASLLARQRPLQWLSLALVVHCLYVLWVGGDYMQGRFVSFAVLLAIVILARIASQARRGGRAALSLLLLPAAYAVLYPRTPLNTPFDQPKDPAGIRAPGREYVMDARATLGHYTSLSSFLTRDRAAAYPRHPLALAGLQLAASDQNGVVAHAGGMVGYHAGLSKIVIEAHGIADPLLARMPASVFAGVGHYIRYRPEGYIDSLIKPDGAIEDVDLRAYHAKLRLLTESDELFSAERLKTILLLNLGVYDHLRDHFIREKIEGKQQLPDGTKRQAPQ